MNIVNFEFKAKVPDIKNLEEKLLTLHPVFHGEDHQVDTYYNVAEGRLKLREGNIENSLIYYERQNTSAAKQSNIILYKHQPGSSLKQILERVHGIKVIVDKRRRIYFINNVKFHFDTVARLGTFLEVEAIDETRSIGIDKLQQQCMHYFEFFNLRSEDYVHCSYSDLLVAQPEA
jgi:predicted adenylyl cyclase CyaB